MKWCTKLNVRRGALLVFFFFFFRSSIKFQGHTAEKNHRFWHKLGVSGLFLIQWWLWNNAQSLKQHRSGVLLFFKVIHQISRSQGGVGGAVRFLVVGTIGQSLGKTTTGSALDGAVFDTAQILAYLVHNMSRSQLYLGFGHFGWLPSFFGQ